MLTFLVHTLLIMTLMMSVAGVVAIPFGVWNLYFFQLVYKPFCLHPNLSIVQIMCLDYAIAVYPLLLIVVLTFMLFKLYEGFKVV